VKAIQFFSSFGTLPSDLQIRDRFKFLCYSLTFIPIKKIAVNTNRKLVKDETS
jgi:hypothetical protein